MCHKTCEELLHSGYTVSGKQSEVDAFIAGKQVLSQQSIGGLKTAVIYGQPEKLYVYLFGNRPDGFTKTVCGHDRRKRRDFI